MTKQVQLSDRAYLFLKAQKRGDESFSDVVLRLGRPRKGLLEMAGAHYFGTYEDLERFRKEDREAEACRDRQRAGRQRRGRA